MSGLWSRERADKHELPVYGNNYDIREGIVKDHFAGAGKPMSDIDRIAFNAAAKYFGEKSTTSLESIIRAALLEYGAIVREECAKVCDDEVAKIRRYDSEGRMKSECGALVTVAAVIRAHQG